MAIAQVDVDKVVAIEAKLEELKALTMGSLSLRAVGGAHIANELINLLPKVKEVKDKLVSEVPVV